MSEVAVYLFLINQMELTFHINTKFFSLHGEDYVPNSNMVNQPKIKYFQFKFSANSL